MSRRESTASRNPESLRTRGFFIHGAAAYYAITSHAGSVMGIRLALIVALACIIIRCIGARSTKPSTPTATSFSPTSRPVDRSGQPLPQPVTVEPMNTYEPPPAPAAQAEARPSAPVTPGYYSQLEVHFAGGRRDHSRQRRQRPDRSRHHRHRCARDHRLLLVLDGTRHRSRSVNGVFELSNVDRGTHTAGARAVDRDGNVLIESSPVTFNLMRVASTREPPVVTPH